MDSISEKKILPHKKTPSLVKFSNKPMKLIKIILVMKIRLIKNQIISTSLSKTPLFGVTHSSLINVLPVFNLYLILKPTLYITNLPYSYLFQILRNSYWGMRPFKLNTSGNARSIYRKSRSIRYFSRKRYNLKKLKKVRYKKLIFKFKKFGKYPMARKPHKVAPVKYNTTLWHNRLLKYSWRRYLRVNLSSYFYKDKYMKMPIKRRKKLIKSKFSLSKRKKILNLKYRTKPYALEHKLLRNNLSLLNVLGFFPMSEPVNLLTNCSSYHPWYKKSRNYNTSLFLSRYMFDFSRSILKNQLVSKSVIRGSKSHNLLKKPDLNLIAKRVLIRYLRGRKVRTLTKLKHIPVTGKYRSNHSKYLEKKIRLLNIRSVDDSNKNSNTTSLGSVDRKIQYNIKRRNDSILNRAVFYAKSNNRLSRSKLVSNFVRSPFGKLSGQFRWSDIFISPTAILFEMANRPLYQKYHKIKKDKDRFNRLVRLKSIALVKALTILNRTILRTTRKGKLFKHNLTTRYILRLLYKRSVDIQSSTHQLGTRNSKLQSMFKPKLSVNMSLSKDNLRDNNNILPIESVNDRVVIQGEEKTHSLEDLKPTYKGSFINTLYNSDVYDSGYLFKPSVTSAIHGSSDQELFNLEGANTAELNRTAKALNYNITPVNKLGNESSYFVKNSMCSYTKALQSYNLTRSNSRLKKKIKPKRSLIGDKNIDISELTNQKNLKLSSIKIKRSLNIKNNILYSNLILSNNLNLRKIISQKHLSPKSKFNNKLTNLKFIRSRIVNVIKAKLLKLSNQSLDTQLKGSKLYERQLVVSRLKSKFTNLDVNLRPGKLISTAGTKKISSDKLPEINKLGKPIETNIGTARVNKDNVNSGTTDLSKGAAQPGRRTTGFKPSVFTKSFNKPLPESRKATNYNPYRSNLGINSVRIKSRLRLYNSRSNTTRLLNTKLLMWVSSKNNQLLKSIIRHKINYKLNLLLSKNKLTTSIKPKISASNKRSNYFFKSNNLVKKKKSIILSGDGNQYKLNYTRLAANKKKSPDSVKKHYNLISNMHDHLINRFSLMSLSKINYVKASPLQDVKYPFFKGNRLSRLPIKLIKFLGYDSVDGRVDLKNKLFLNDILPTKHRRLKIYKDIGKFTNYKKIQFFSKNSLVFFRNPKLASYIIRPAKKLQDRYRKNWKKKKLLLALKLKILGLKLHFSKKRQVNFRKTSKFKEKNFRRRRLGRRFFKNKKYLTKVKLPNRRVKKPWQKSKTFRKKWWKLRKKRHSIFFIKRKVKKIKSRLIKRFGVLSKFNINDKIIQKSNNLQSIARSKSMLIDSKHFINMSSIKENTNEYTRSLKSLSYRISTLNKDKFIIRGSTKGQILVEKIKKHINRSNYNQSTNVIKLNNFYKYWIRRYWLLKKRRKMLLRSKVNPELYLTSLRSKQTKYVPFTKYGKKTYKRTRLSKLKFSNNTNIMFKSWRRKSKKQDLTSSLARRKWISKPWAREKWLLIKSKQTAILRKKINENRLFKKLYLNIKTYTSKEERDKKLRYQWCKDNVTKVWSKKVLSYKSFNKKTRDRIINSKNRYIKAGYKKSNKWRKRFRVLNSKKIRTSNYKKRSTLDSFRTLYRPIVNIKSRWESYNIGLYKSTLNLGVTRTCNKPLTDYVLLIHTLIKTYLTNSTITVPSHNLTTGSTSYRCNYLYALLTNTCGYTTLRNNYGEVLIDYNLELTSYYIFDVRILKPMTVENGSLITDECLNYDSNYTINDSCSMDLYSSDNSDLESNQRNLKKLLILRSRLTSDKSNVKLENTDIDDLNLEHYLVNKATKFSSKHKLKSVYLTTSGINQPYMLMLNDKDTTSAQDKFSIFVTRYIYHMLNTKGASYGIKKLNNLTSIVSQPILFNHPRTLNTHGYYTVNNNVTNHFNSNKYLVPKSTIRNKRKLTCKFMTSCLSSTLIDSISHDIGFNRLVFVNYDLFTAISKRSSLVGRYSKKLIFKLSYEFGSLSPTFFIDEVISVILLALRYKDSDMLMGWVTYFFNKIDIRKHKKALAFLKKLFKSLNRTKRLYKLGCKGFMFDIRGKVGVSGSKKKRHVSILYGERSASSKDLRWSYKKDLVYTKTGVLGVTIVIYY